MYPTPFPAVIAVLRSPASCNAELWSDREGTGRDDYTRPWLPPSPPSLLKKWKNGNISDSYRPALVNSWRILNSSLVSQKEMENGRASSLWTGSLFADFSLPICPSLEACSQASAHLVPTFLGTFSRINLFRLSLTDYSEQSLRKCTVWNHEESFVRDNPTDENARAKQYWNNASPTYGK